MSVTVLAWLLLILLPCGIMLGAAAWLLRRKSEAQQELLRNLYAVAENMISAADPNLIYRRIVDAVPKMVRGTHCYLMVHNRVTRQLDVLAGSDKFPTASIAMDVVSGPVSCFNNRALLEVPDAENCPFVDRSIVHRLGQKSLLFVPMISDGEIFGVLEIDDRRRRRTFTEEQKACAQHVANLGALAMKLCEQRTMREQLYRTEKMAAVGELISGVAHELKTPLASLVGLSEMALTRHSSSSALQDLKAIHAEAQHANTILQRLISFARPQKAGPRQVDVNSVLRSVVAAREPKWESRGIRVHLQLSQTPPLVANDPYHLEQVFLNLLFNAERSLEDAKEKLITVRTTIVARRVLISISDTGGGRSQELKRLFGPVYDRKHAAETTGLGLAVCRSLIEGHGGSVRVTTSPGHSTTFEIEYPLAEPAARTAPPAAETATAAKRRSLNLTALVIDEDRRVQDSLLNLLSDRSYRVVTVSSAEEALDLTARARFDLVLCEIRIRGLSGLELCRRMQGRIHCFVFLTGDNFGSEMHQMLAEQNHLVLTKPFTAADVERVLNEVEPRLMNAHAGQAN